MIALTRRSLATFVSALVAASACTPAPTVSSTPARVPGAMGTTVAASAPSLALPNGMHWARNSAEHRAIYVEVYRVAGDKLAAHASAHPANSWGVILDADETVLDNSDYEKARAPFGGTFDPAAWNAWVMQGRAPALPGAVAFTARVHQLGGEVVIVTNRDEAQCPATRGNLSRVGLAPDLVLCKTTTSDKNPRFDAVQNGTAAAGFPVIAVLEWFGDNIQDFPHLSQQMRTAPDSAFARFGETYFALPNAMYGSWEANPRR